VLLIFVRASSPVSRRGDQCTFVQFCLINVLPQTAIMLVSAKLVDTENFLFWFIFSFVWGIWSHAC